MAASVWIIDDTPCPMERAFALTIPAVTVLLRPRGLPTASTHSPTFTSSLLAMTMAGRFLASILMRARSVVLSAPMMRAEYSFEFSFRVTVSSSGSLASFESGMTRYVSRLVRGNFPDLLGLFPSGASSTFTLDSDELSQAVSRVSVMAVGTMAVTISSGGGEVRLGCATADYGSSEEVVAADCDGEARVMLNAKYLRQVLAACHGEVRVGIGGPLAPVTFDGLGSIRSRCMLMPVRG